ncbi:hypothetical protein R1flu_005345 [Riccia fluitans]|uniref:KOW domain-containing protein n=1 Tax=Riccia fluitans TaxID=41844 RepID=A0ABD1YSX1_9MARC
MATMVLQTRVSTGGTAASCSSSFMGLALSPARSLPFATLRRPLTISVELKRWERKEVKPNSLPVRQNLHVKVGDTVQVISGADKKKIGEVARVYTHNSKIIVKNVNLKTKHVKGKAEGETGQIVQIEAPIHSSNVMLYSKEAKVASRVGHKVVEGGKKVRYLLKTGEIIDSTEEWKKTNKKEKLLPQLM